MESYKSETIWCRVFDPSSLTVWKSLTCKVTSLTFAGKGAWQNSVVNPNCFGGTDLPWWWSQTCTARKEADSTSIFKKQAVKPWSANWPSSWKGSELSAIWNELLLLSFNFIKLIGIIFLTAIWEGERCENIELLMVTTVWTKVPCSGFATACPVTVFLN